MAEAEAPEKRGEGKQLQFFKVHNRKMIEDIMSSIRDEDLVNVLDFSSLKRKKLQHLAQVFKETTVTGYVKRIENFLVLEDMDTLFAKREDIITQQKIFEGTTAWRPSGSVTDDVRTHDMAVYKSKGQQLAVMCEREEKDADALLAQVEEGRKLFLKIQAQLAESNKTLKNLLEGSLCPEEAHNKLFHTLYPVDGN